MKPESQILIYIVALLFLDTIIPVPITAIILLLVVLQRPAWFAEIFHQVYK